jgi:hypothetical protein
MTGIHVSPIPTVHARAIWNGDTDAHGMAPERHVSDGDGVPCRHCLQHVAAGEPYLILAYRPFPDAQPYAEVGPIFLHAEPCPAYRDHDRVPAMILAGEPRIVRAYGRDDRIRYGTGKVVAPEAIADYARTLLDDPETAYVHVRSSTNNCYAFRIDRSD